MLSRLILEGLALDRKSIFKYVTLTSSTVKRSPSLSTIFINLYKHVESRYSSYKSSSLPPLFSPLRGGPREGSDMIHCRALPQSPGHIPIPHYIYENIKILFHNSYKNMKKDLEALLGR